MTDRQKHDKESAFGSREPVTTLGSHITLSDGLRKEQVMKTKGQENLKRWQDEARSVAEFRRYERERVNSVTLTPDKEQGAGDTHPHPGEGERN